MKIYERKEKDKNSIENLDHLPANKKVSIDLEPIKKDLVDEMRKIYLLKDDNFLNKGLKHLSKLLHHAKEEALDETMKDIFMEKKRVSIDELVSLASGINVLLEFKYRFINFGAFFAPIWKFLFPFFLSYGAVLLTVRSLKDLDIRDLFGISIASFILIILIIIALAVSFSFFVIKMRHRRMFAIYINERLEYIINCEFLKGNYLKTK